MSKMRNVKKEEEPEIGGRHGPEENMTVT